MNSEKQIAEKLPIIFNKGNEIVFNKAAVSFVGIVKANIDEDVMAAQDFISSNPDLTIETKYKELVALQSALRRHRTGIDKKRKGLGQIFRDATAYINDKAKEIIGQAHEVENQLKELRNAHEAEVERIAQEEARKEEERVNKIESRICFIRDLPSECIGRPAKLIADYISELSDTEDDFQEFEEVGSAALERSLKQLKKLLESAIAEEERAEKERVAEEERKRREAEERAELERQQEDLAIQQEAASIQAGVVKFMASSQVELNAEIKRLKTCYEHSATVLVEAARTAIISLESLIPAAEQREAVARQAAEQEAERQRIETEKQAEEQRRAEEEARKKAEHEELVKKAKEAAERKRLAEEAECRKAEDFGRTVAALSDLLGKVCECEAVIDIAETVAEAIQDGEIPFVTWGNER